MLSLIKMLSIFISGLLSTDWHHASLNQIVLIQRFNIFSKPTFIYLTKILILESVVSQKQYNLQISNEKLDLLRPHWNNIFRCRAALSLLRLKRFPLFHCHYHYGVIFDNLCPRCWPWMLIPVNCAINIEKRWICDRTAWLSVYF
jgi:hypothetical protein